MIRRPVAAAAAAVLAAALPIAGTLALPAAAHPEGWASSGWGIAPEHVFGEVPVIAFTLVHDAESVTQPGVERARYSVAPAGDALPPGCELPPAGEVRAPPDRAEDDTLSAAVTLPISCNGRYVITVTGFTGTNRLTPDPESHTMTLPFGVALPAPPPTGVEVALADLDGDRAVRLTWLPPEPLPPDLVG